MNEPWKYIDWLEGIPPTKYKITMSGILYSTAFEEDTPISQRFNGGYVVATVSSKGWSGPLVKKSLSISKAVLRAFKPRYDIDMDSKSIRVLHKDGDPENNHLDNLEWGVYGKMGEYITVDQRKEMIEFIAEHRHLSYTEIARLCSEKFNEEVGQSLVISLIGRSCSIRRNRSLTALQFEEENVIDDNVRRIHLTDDEVHKICKSIIKHKGETVAVYDELHDEIPNMVTRHITDIRNKRRYSWISDQYFDDPVSQIWKLGDPPRKEYPDLPHEIWRKANEDDWRPYYVSNLGRVKNDHGRILTQWVSAHGLCCVCFRSDDGGSTLKSVPKLVAKAFIPLDDDIEKYSVYHKNGDQNDNQVSNLKWVAHGSDKSCDGGLTKEDIDKILSIISVNENLTPDQICDIISDNLGLDVKPYTIYGIIRKRNKYGDFTNI